MPKRRDAIVVLASHQRVIEDPFGRMICGYCFGIDGDHADDCLWYALFQCLEDLKDIGPVLEWYAEKARSLARYMTDTPPNPIPVTAIVTELSLDGGLRAASLPKESA